MEVDAVVILDVIPVVEDKPLSSQSGMIVAITTTAAVNKITIAVANNNHAAANQTITVVVNNNPAVDVIAEAILALLTFLTLDLLHHLVADVDVDNLHNILEIEILL